MNNEQKVLVKALLKLITVHLTSDFDVVRQMAIVKIFDEELCHEGQQFVLNNIHVPKDKAHLCSTSKMAELHNTLKIRTTF